MLHGAKETNKSSLFQGVSRCVWGTRNRYRAALVSLVVLQGPARQSLTSTNGAFKRRKAIHEERGESWQNVDDVMFGSPRVVRIMPVAFRFPTIGSKTASLRTCCRATI